ncbi:TonB-dependent receptor [Pseudomaricurvus sp. HS19]|uniref:TonB-dependent receptor n=1 Tax=Pseudomaricurvus sp. HS19 TaxID=2692626 RepID=UPI00136B26FC|nr:TonB-dependent receptor [Pseudomaricurvus sp. HS19]MYM63445.1 TonB-dependent receptor [Pseudomaricurvus sp. HS19]
MMPAHQDKRRSILRPSALAAAVIATLPVASMAATAERKLALEEVIVTAQRREESQQDVPVAVTAANFDDMVAAQVDSIANIEQISPSIKFDVTNSAANSANILIRGIGTVGNSRAFEGAVGVFVDGVYRTRAGQAMQNWLDVESLQILRGPQGTLFGKNTSAGALLLESKRPDSEAFGGDYEATIGNYGKKLARVGVNVPVAGVGAFRIAGLVGEEDGYIEDPNGGDYNGREPRAVKAQFLLDGIEDFTARLIVDWSKEENNCCYGQVDAIDGPFQPLIDNVFIPMRGLKAPSSDFDDYEQVLSNDTEQTIEDQGAVLQLEWALSDTMTLKSVTSYRDWEINQQGMDADFSGANVLTINEGLKTETISQEFTLSGELDEFAFFQSADYVLGLYYADEEIEAPHQLLWGDQAQMFFDILIGAAGVADASEGLWSDAFMPASSETKAAFMHWNLELTDRLGFSVGLRYSKDEKEGALERNYFNPSPVTPFRLLGVQPGPTYSDSFEDEALSGSLAARYHITDDVMAYASYSRGYKSGGVNIDNTAAGTVMNNPDEVPGAVPLDPTYKSEFIDGYELGVKADYWDGRARTNVAAFYNDITDLQIAQFIGTQFTIDNAADAEVYGLEMENQLLLTEAIKLNFDVTYLAEAKFGDDPALGALADREFAQAPEFTGNLALSAEEEVIPGLLLSGRIGVSYAGEAYTNTSNDYTRDAQTEYTASVGIGSVSGLWSVTAWCQNCSDERYPTQHFNSPLQGPDANAYVSAPRTYGLTLRGSF